MTQRSGFSVTEVLLTVVALTFVVLGLLQVLGPPTRVRDTESEPDLSLESAVRTVSRDVRNAGAGPLAPLACVIPLPHCGEISSESGDVIRVERESSCLALRGVLRHPVLALDEHGRETGEPLSFASQMRKNPSSVRLRVYVYPAVRNPARIWEPAPRGKGALFAPALAGAGQGRVPGRRNEPFDSTLATLGANSPQRPVFFLVADLAGTSAVGKVLTFDASVLEKGCDCASPVRPSDCPPGRAGCFFEMVLDFVDPVARQLSGGGTSEKTLGGLSSGGILDEIRYFIARDVSGPYLASARARGEKFEVSRVAEGISGFHVAYGLARGRKEPFSPQEFPVHGGSPRSPNPGADEWWPNTPDETTPGVDDFDDGAGGSLLRMLQLTFVATGRSPKPEVTSSFPNRMSRGPWKQPEAPGHTAVVRVAVRNVFP